MDVLYKGLSGSRAYGMAGPTSDYDYRVIVADSKESVFGISKPFEAEHKIVDGNDTHTWGLKHFCRTVAHGSPEMLEALFIEPESVYVSSGAYKDLVRIRSAFVSKNYVKCYLGYMRSQIKLIEKHDKPEGSHAEYVAKYGYDTKAAAHFERLSQQAFYLFLTGSVYVRLQEKVLEKVMSIRNGQVSKVAFLEEANEDIFALEAMGETANLQDKPDFDTINEFLYIYYGSKYSL